MLPETELIQYVQKTAQMGCEGILSVMPYAQEPSFKRVLQDQLDEYRHLEQEAGSLLESKGEDRADVGILAKCSARAMSAGKLIADSSDSKIAEMTIQGNNMGVSKTLAHLHDYKGQDDKAKDLASRLLATEKANVQQLQPYL